VSVTTYETVFIAEPEISNDQVDQLINKIKLAITANQGTLTGEDRWGRRRLAYAIHGHREGYYAILNFTAEAGVVLAIEHLYNVTDAVMRHLTTRVIKSKKTFRPRKEKPAGYDASRHSGRPTGPSRPNSGEARNDVAARGRTDAPVPARQERGSPEVAKAGTETSTAAMAAAPVAATAPEPAPAPAPVAPEDGTPA
jgi:small subunit ribosomal protein S6